MFVSADDMILESQGRSVGYRVCFSRSRMDSGLRTSSVDLLRHPKGEAWGRPVGVACGQTGVLCSLAD